MTPVPLIEAGDPGRFGGKAAQLARALEAGLPVPDGWALPAEAAAALAEARALPPALERLVGDGPLAVRSSAIGEDGEGASYAGQLCSILNVRTGDALLRALCEVHASGASASASRYHERHGGRGPLQVGVVIQRMVEPRASGVLFTCHPLDGSDVRMVEASWGLGEAVVAGLVTPDRFVFPPGRSTTEREPGHKDLEIVVTAGGGTGERPVPESKHAELCLGDRDLDQLDALASACDRVWSGPHDVEFAFDQQGLRLLQRRPVTARGAAATARGAP